MHALETQALRPVSMRSTITGATMMLINVFAIGSLLVGGISDRLAVHGSSVALTTVLIATGVLMALSLWLFWRASSGRDERLGMARDPSLVAH